MTETRNGTLYEIRATRNGQTVTLQFTSKVLWSEARRALRRESFEVNFEPFGTVIFKSIESALESANLATR